MIPASNPLYRQALAAGHQPYARVEVWRGGVQVEELTYTDPFAQTTSGAPVFVGGGVRATLASRVTRTLSLTVPDWLYPWKSSDLLNPYGQVLRAYRGIRYGSGLTDEFPIFVGPILNVKPQGTTAVVNAGDLASDVVSSSFSAPNVANVGDKLTSEVKRLITGALPHATFGRFDPITSLVPALSYDVDRGGALDGLAKAAGALWYSLAGGDFVLRYIPWTVPLTSGGLPLTNVGGSLISAFPTRDRAGVFSRVTMSNEPLSGGPPSYATADDVDPASPTYVNGPYGVKAAQIRITQATTQGTVLQAAKAALARGKALTEAWSITCVADGSIELGDPLNVTFRDRSGNDHLATQIVAGFSIPLDAHQTMSIDGRFPVGGDITG